MAGQTHQQTHQETRMGRRRLAVLAMQRHLEMVAMEMVAMEVMTIRAGRHLLAFRNGG